MTNTDVGRDWASAFDGEPISNFDPSSPEVKERRARSKKHRHEDANAKRLDIQGLRMVAVVAVVINHLTGHPQGGFLGVDVFFVISGYLITGLLLREEVRTGKISLLDFYRRRIRRLFPAALTVTLGTLIAAYALFDSARAHNTLVDSIWATLFSANWRFLNIGTDYFKSEGPESPLQHYWSLSVEEQFYVVWPLVLMIVLLVARRVFRGRQTAVAVTGMTAAGALCVASLIYAHQLMQTNVTEAYFSTFTRGWELGLGALLSVAAPFMRGNRIVLTIMSFFGLAVIIASLFFVKESQVPFPGAIVPCLAAGVVLMAWSPRGGTARNVLLTNPVSTYLGDISYSIYVVHFPIIVIVNKTLLTSDTVATRICSLLLILGVSMLLFHLIENPIRNSNWLKPKHQRGTNVNSDVPRKVPGVLGSALAVLSLAAFLLVWPNSETKLNDINTALNSLSTSAAPVTDSAGQTEAPKQLPPLLAKQQAAIISALKASKWPTLHPSMTDAPNIEPPYLAHCGNSLGSITDCTWPSLTAKHKAYLVGDSTSVAYTPAFKGAISKEPDWSVRAAGGFGCPFASVYLADGPANNHAKECPARNDEVVAEIKAKNPDVLVVTTVIGSQQYVDGVAGEIKKVEGHFKKLVIVPAPPKVKDPATCYNATSSPYDCASKISTVYDQYLANWRDLAAKYKGTVIDMRDFYCAAGFCPAFVGDIPTRKDTNHTTAAYSESLAPVLLETLKEDKFFDVG